MQELIEEIKEMRQKAIKEYNSLRQIDINAYGTGYELGYADALGELLEFIKDNNLGED